MTSAEEIRSFECKFIYDQTFKLKIKKFESKEKRSQESIRKGSLQARQSASYRKNNLGSVRVNV